MLSASSTATTTTPVIEVRGLWRRFGVVPALCGVDLDVSAGELLLVLGPNGAGKSTLLRSLAGLARPSRGTVRILGGDVHAQPAVRGAIGFLSHQTLLYDDLTARENLHFAAALHGLDAVERRVMDALNMAGLDASADRRTGTFSRGMLQRLAIARATLHAPALLLLDEPFTGLDSTAAGSFRDRLASERAAGRAVLCVTHEPAEVWDAATRIVVLAAGTVIFDVPRSGDVDAFRRDYHRMLPA